MTNESQDNQLSPVEESIFDNSKGIFDNANQKEQTKIKDIGIFLEELADKLQKKLFDEFEALYEKLVKFYTSDSSEKADTLYQIALLTSKYTDTNFSLKYWQKSIEVYEKLNDQHSKALIIHNMATTMATNGDNTSAKKFWYESILIKERINDTLGIAASLCNLAWLAHSEKDYEHEISLYLKSIELLVTNSAWSEVVNVLIKLSEVDLNRDNYYLAQALFIAIHIFIEPKTVFSIVSNLIKNLGFEHEYSPIISSSGIILTWSDDVTDEALELQSISKEVMIACALARKINESDISEWIITNKLNDAEYIFSALETTLLQISKNENWFFESKNLNNL